MRRYFYNSGTLVSKWLEKNAFAKAYEDEVYRSAFLAALKNDTTLQFAELREQILNMTIQEQRKYANNVHIQQLFTLFHSLHKYSRGRSMIVDARNSRTVTDLVDPDKFPIWDLKSYSPVYKSIWDYHLAELRFQMGFQPIIRQSQVQHIAGGRGVYTILSHNKQKIKAGEFIGLVPGKIFSSLEDFKSMTLKNKKDYQRIPQHLHFPSGKLLVLGEVNKERSKSIGLEIQKSESTVDATFHNPFAIGHMINHPPPNHQPNVCFGQMNIKVNYFPKYLWRYLPYEYFTLNKKEVTLFGVFALKEIENKEELFVNYNESHIYPIDNIPQWMIEPPKFSQIFNYLKKGEYQITQSAYWKIVEKKALQKNKQLFEKYQNLRILRPDKVEFEDQKRRYKKLKMRMEDENQYEHL